MSTLQVSTIKTESNTTSLILATGNTLGGKIIVQSANSDIMFDGVFKTTGNTLLSGDGSGITNINSVVANAAFTVANAAYSVANGVSTNTTAAFGFANGVSTNTTAAFAKANGVSTNTTAAFAKANTALQNTTGTFEGTLTVTGNTVFSANAVLSNTNIVGIRTASFNAQATQTSTSGSLTIDWTVAQNWKQTEPTGTITYTFTAPTGPCHLQLIIDSDGTSTAQTINWPGTVIWLVQTFSGTNNKKSVINFWYDGTNYYAMGSTQV